MCFEPQDLKDLKTRTLSFGHRNSRPGLLEMLTRKILNFHVSHIIRFLTSAVAISQYLDLPLFFSFLFHIHPLFSFIISLCYFTFLCFISLIISVSLSCIVFFYRSDIYVSIYLPVCLSVYLPMYLSIPLSIYLPIYQPLSLFVFTPIPSTTILKVIRKLCSI